MTNIIAIALLQSTVTYYTNVAEFDYKPEPPRLSQGSLYIGDTKDIRFYNSQKMLLTGSNFMTIGSWGSIYQTNGSYQLNQNKFVQSNVVKQSTISFKWNGQLREIVDNELVTNVVWQYKLKQDWELIKP